MIDFLLGEGTTKSIQGFFGELEGPIAGGLIKIGKLFKDTEGSTAPLVGFNLAIESLGKAFTALKDGNISGVMTELTIAMLGIGLGLLTLPLEIFGDFITKIGELTGVQFLEDAGNWLSEIDTNLLSLGQTVAGWVGSLVTLTSITEGFDKLAGAINALVTALLSTVGIKVPDFILDLIPGLGGGGGIKDIVLANTTPQGDLGGIVGGGGNNLLAQNALGGFIPRNSPSMVGERGPELFMPNSGGMIVPNNKLGGGGITINNPTFIGQSPHEALLMLERAVKDSGS